MKRNKAFLEIEGKSLVERSLEVLQEIFSEVIVSTNQPDLYARYGLPMIQDEILGVGPLEGLHQGLKAASYDSVFFVACDMPFLNGNLIRFLSTWANEYEIVVPRLQDGLHPLHAFYQRRCLPNIEKNLEAGSLKIMDFLYSTSSVRYVEEEDLDAHFDLSMAFCNANTPEEWSAILTQRSVQDKYKY